MTINYITLNGTRVRYLQAGSADKPVLLLLHAWPATADMYIPTFAYLSGSFNCLSFDFPGFGQSASISDPNYDRYASYIFQFLKTQKIKSVYLSGSSMGGAVALVFAARYPGFVKKIVIHAPPIDLGSHHRRLYSYLRQLIKKPTVKYSFVSIAKSPLGRLYLYVRDKKYRISYQFIKQIHQTAKFSDPDTIAALANCIMTANLKSLVKSITIPTLLLIGQQEYWDLASDAKTAQKLNPAIKLVTVKNANHRFSICSPRRFAKLISDFIIS